MSIRYSQVRGSRRGPSRAGEKHTYYADAPDQYTGHREGSNRPISSWPAGAMVEVTRGGEQPYFNFKEHPSTGGVYSDSAPSELFHNTPHHISNIEADASMRMPAMTLVSRAILDYPGLAHGFSMTRQAAPLAKKAIDKGLLSSNPSNPTLRINTVRSTRKFSNRSDPEYRDKLPASDLQQARNYMRASLGRKSNKLSTAQFQPQLPIFQQPPVPGK